MSYKRLMNNDECEAYFKGLRPLNKTEMSWIQHEALPQYILYDSRAKKAWCSHCEHDIDIGELGKMTSGRQVKCPRCGRMVKLRNRTGKLGVHMVYDDMYVAIPTRWTRKDGTKCVVVRHFLAMKRHLPGDLRKVETIAHEIIRDVSDGSGKELFFDWSCGRGGWSNCRSVKDPYYGTRLAQHVKLYYARRFEIYAKGVGKATKGTGYEHSCAEEFIKLIWHREHQFNYHYVLNNYLSAYDDTPLFEYLMKMGFCTMARSIFRDGTQKWNVNKKGKTLQEMLGITRMQLAELRSLGDPSTGILPFMQRGCTLEDWRNYSVALKQEHYVERFFDAFPSKDVKSSKFARWYCSCEKKFPTDIYIDYLNMAKELGWDLRSEFVLFPKDVRKSHDVAVKLFNAKKDEIRDVSLKKVASVQRERFGFAMGGMAIVVPETSKAIADEGIALHHCVGTYIDRVCQGSTNILFVRMLGETDKPFYTMEVSKNGTIVQCRGKNNCAMTDGVKAFIGEFAKAKSLTVPVDMERRAM